MAGERIHRDMKWTPEDRARHKAIREKFPKERPSLKELAGSGDAAPAIPIGLYLELRVALAAEAAAQPAAEVITAEMVKNAEWVAGVTLTDEQRKSVAGALADVQRRLGLLRKMDMGYDIAPAVHFTPTPGEPPSEEGRGT